MNVEFESDKDRLCVQFDIQEDDIALEGNETFSVRFDILSGNTTAQPGDRPTSIVTIIDNDGNKDIFQTGSKNVQFFLDFV